MRFRTSVAGGLPLFGGPRGFLGHSRAQCPFSLQYAHWSGSSWDTQPDGVLLSLGLCLLCLCPATTVAMILLSSFCLFLSLAASLSSASLQPLLSLYLRLPLIVNFLSLSQDVCQRAISQVFHPF